MTRKIYWGLAILIVLLIGVSVFLLMQNTDTEPKVIINDVSEEQLDDIRKQIHSQIKSTPKPPDEPGFKWVWHQNHWDKVKIDEVVSKTPVVQEKTPIREGENGSPNQYVKPGSYHDRLYKKYGVDPPPLGYDYRRSDPWVLKLDENGNPILYKIGEAVFDVHKVPGFAPTYEQYQQYKELIRKRDHERRTGNDAAADQFNAEIYQLKSKAQGLIPIVGSSLGVPTHLAKSALEAEDRRASEILRQAYIDMGLGHMVTP